jgi:hypothetical protein
VRPEGLGNLIKSFISLSCSSSSIYVIEAELDLTDVH